MADPQKIVEELKRLKFREVSFVRTFEAVRPLENGGDQMVTIRVYDEGEGSQRYSAEAEGDGKQTQRSNSWDTVDKALLNIHWNELD